MPLYEMPQGPRFGTLVVRATHRVQLIEPEGVTIHLCRYHAYALTVDEVRSWEDLG